MKTRAWDPINSRWVDGVTGEVIPYIDVVIMDTAERRNRVLEAPDWSKVYNGVHERDHFFRLLNLPGAE